MMNEIPIPAFCKKKQKQTKANFFKLASIKNRYAVMLQKLKSL